MAANASTGRPRAPFFVVLFLVVAALAAYGLKDKIFPKRAPEA